MILEVSFLPKFTGRVNAIPNEIPNDLIRKKPKCGFVPSGLDSYGRVNIQNRFPLVQDGTI
jgi:hypothetical protein